MNHQPYPRPELGPKERSVCGRKAFGAILVFLGVSGCCTFSGAQMIMEGPHGPNGRITGEPSAPRTILLIVAVSAAVVFWGVTLLRGGPR